MLVWPKQSQGRYSTRVMLGNEELAFVEEFPYLGHVMTADWRDDKDIKKLIQEAKCIWQYADQKVLIYTYWGKNPIVQIILLLHLWMCSLASFIPELHFENLLSVIVTDWSFLLMSPDTPGLVWHFDERNWQYQCGVPKICLQLDEQSNSFPQQYCYGHCQ